MENPEERYGGFQSLLEIILARKGLIIAGLLGVLTITIVGSFLMPPIYRASTTIMIEPMELLRLEKGYVGPFERELFMGNQKEIIRSRTIAERVVRQLDLDENHSNPPSPLNDILSNVIDKFFRANPNPFYKAVNKLRKELSVESTLGFSILNIGIEDEDPTRAANIVSAVAEVYTEFTYENAVSKSRSAYDFIKKQSKTAKWKLNQARQDLQRFKQKEGMADLAVETRICLDRRAALRALLLDTLSEYPESDPRVIRTKQELSELNVKLRELPEKELELAKLTQIAKSSEEIYSMLLTKLEEARISENTEIKGLGSITVVDPAIPPPYPLRRKKVIFIFLGSIMSLVFAFVMALFSEYSDSSIKTSKNVKQYLGLKVLGIIPLTPKKGRKRFLGFGP